MGHEAMGAGALTARLNGLTVGCERAGRVELVLGLGFHEPGGPLLAVCATAGGAGASTLAVLVATQAARESRAAVLACDTGGPTAGLARHVGVESRLSLGELAEGVESGKRIGGEVFAHGPDGLRVVGAGPRFRASGSAAGVEAVLAQARAAHGLGVVDCGTIQREAGQVAFELATHRVWIVTANPHGVAAAERVLAQVVQGGVPEAIVARGGAGGRAPMRELRRLAERRGAPLILLPELPAKQAPISRAAAERGQGALAALGGWLRR